MVDVKPLLREEYTEEDSSGTQPPTSQLQAESPDEKPVAPSAPPENVVGYEGVTFTPGGFLAPPQYDADIQPVPTSDRPAPRLPTHVTEQQARDSLLTLARQNFCWGSKAARDMVIDSMSSSSAFHYQVESFTESRKSTWAFQPYNGEPVDGPHNGPAPPAWSIQIQPDGMFKNQEKQCKVPHTAYVKQCHGCNGMGRRGCTNCQASGRTLCTSCRGKGFRIQVHHHDHHHHDHHPHGHHHNHPHHHSHGHGGVHEERIPCTFCTGSGCRICTRCHGNGQVKCSSCNGRGQLLYFIKLTVNWTVHVDDHIVETTALPDNLVRGASGVIAFEESSLRIIPVTHFPNDEINSASRRLVQQHNTSYPNERILMQRHRVRVVPVSEVQANYSGRIFTFWVYGSENLCHASEYPQQCCCGCTIL